MSRRFLVRLTAVLTAAASLSCSDALFGTRDRVANIALQPRFSDRDAAIYSSLNQFGLAVQTLRVVLVRPVSDTVADTTITVDPAQDSVLVQLKVTLQAVTENFTANLEMRSGSTIVFTGSSTITAHAAGTGSGAPAPVITPVWVGPGRDAATIRIAPRDTTVLPATQISFSAVAKDANNVAVTDPDFVSRFQWLIRGSSPTASTLSATGQFVAGPNRGTARVVVFTPNNLRDSVTVTVVPPATQLVVISGNGQTGTPGTALPGALVVEVRAADGLPVPNVMVHFRAVTGGGSVATDSILSSASGRAQTLMTLGSASTTQTYEASVTGLAPVTVTETSTAIAASISFPRGLEIVDRGGTKAVTATVKSQTGAPMTAPISYLTRNTGIATINTSGTITGVAAGQVMVIAWVTTDSLIRDSLLAVIAEPTGPVAVSSIEQFIYPRDTTFTVSVFVDMHASTKRLGSTTIDVEWNPAHLVYQSNANATTGISPTVNTTNTATGKLTLAFADVAGFTGRIELLKVTFKSSTTAATGQLKLTAREMNATDYTDLLPITSNVIHPIRTP